MAVRRCSSASGRLAVVTAVAILGGVLLATAVRVSSIKVIRITSGSMSPTVQPGDWVLERDPDSDAASWANRGDIVLFAFPIGSEGRAIKRVIGLPGDEIVIRKRTITVNGRTIPISGAPGETAAGPRTQTVPAGTLFLLGDNAIDSIDSRSFGAVPEKEVYGRVLLPLRQWMVWLGFGLVAAVSVVALLLNHPQRLQSPLGRNG